MVSNPDALKSPIAAWSGHACWIVKKMTNYPNYWVQSPNNQKGLGRAVFRWSPTIQQELLHFDKRCFHSLRRQELFKVLCFHVQHFSRVMLSQIKHSCCAFMGNEDCNIWPLLLPLLFNGELQPADYYCQHLTSSSSSFWCRIATGGTIIANIWPRLSPARISASFSAHLTSIQFY